MKTLTKDLLAVARIASTSTIRPVLQNILITKDEIVATDTRMLLKIDRNLDDSLPVDDFPVGFGSNPIKPIQSLDKPILIPAKQLLKKQKFPKNCTVPIIEQAIISDDNNRTVSISTTDLETVDTITYSKGEGDFPKYQSVIPDAEKATAKLKVNPKLLIKLLKAFENKNGVHLHIFDKTTPLLITESEKTGLLMPILE